MKAKDDFLQLTGYRLPTEAEWEFACRAGTTTSRYYGQAETLLPKYAWYRINSENHLWPVAILKPNDFGLFDMLGNANDWCYDNLRSNDYPPIESTEVVLDAAETSPVEVTSRRVIRGGGYKNAMSFIRSAHRNNSLPDSEDSWRGLRPARTLLSPP